MDRKLTYKELVEHVKKLGLKDKFNVVSYLIGLYGVVDVEDWETIIKLSNDGYID